MFTSIDVVAGAQFGSESKGRVAGDLVVQRTRQLDEAGMEEVPVISVRVGGPNAGHVVVGKNGQHFAMRQIPVGFIESNALLFIAAGSEVDFDVLDAEVELLQKAGYEDVLERLYLDPQATVLEPKHVAQERNSDLTARLGSTAKGIGAARADRIWRTARLVRDSERAKRYQVENLLTRMRKLRPSVVIEGTQGYGLGLHAGYYPQCTSGDCRAIDFLAQAGVNPWDVPSRDRFNVHLVVRPYPIRVAGNSGPLHEETSWSELGLPDERTTVTHKVRRVGHFNLDLVRAAALDNGSNRVFFHLAMADQVDPTLEGINSYEPAERWERLVSGLDSEKSEYTPQARELLSIVRDLSTVATVVSLGTGPDSAVRISGVDFTW